jgi:hypothetical protein
MHPTMLLIHKLFTSARLAFSGGLPNDFAYPQSALSVGSGRPTPPSAQQVALVRPSPCNFRPRDASKPLRVLRVVESGQPRCSVGRMVISGRMADVCAELDRLVAHEASLH